MPGVKKNRGRLLELTLAGAGLSRAAKANQLLVWRRQSKSRKDIKMVTLDISDDVDSIVDNYLPDINRKFREFFNKELHHVLAGKVLPVAA